MPDDLLLAVAAGVALGLLGGALGPLLLARLPEPPAPAPPEPGPDGELTTAQQARLEEGPKETYAAMAALPWLRPTLLGLGGLAGGLVGATLGWSWALVLWLPLVPVGVLLGVVDARTRLLPARILLPATGYTLVVALASWPLLDAGQPLVRGLVGLVLARSVFWLLWFVRQAGMGFGDVRLAALLGLALAYVGWAEWLVGLYSGFLVFALPGLALAVVRRDRALLKKAFPFGPFMLAGALVGLLVGPTLLAGLAAG